MSTFAASTKNRIGLRPIQNRLTMSGAGNVVAYPAEKPAYAGNFFTHAVAPAPAASGHRHGIGAALMTMPDYRIAIQDTQRLPLSATSGAVNNAVLPNPAMATFAPSSTVQATGSLNPTSTTAMAPQTAPQSLAEMQAVANANAAAGAAAQAAAGGVQSSNAVTLTPTSAATPAVSYYPNSSVPITWPTTSPYTDASGNVWSWNGTSWSITAGSATAAAAAASTTPSVDTTVNTGIDITAITAWLQSETLISTVPNFFVLAGVGVLGLIVFNMSRGTGKR